jgi:hypothetical protein
MPDDLSYVNNAYAGADGQSVYFWAYWGGIENPDSLLRFDIESGEITGRFLTASIESFASSPVSTAFATVSSGRDGLDALHVFDDTLLYSESLELRACGSGAVAYSPDGLLLALAADGALTIYDAATFDMLTRVETPCQAVTAIDFTFSGRFLAVFQQGGIGTVYEVVRE